MPSPLAIFHSNMRDAAALSDLYTFLSGSVGGPFSFDDLLRSRIVYSVSAFDKLIHDLVREGMVEIYCGKRPPTPKFNSEPIPLQSAFQLSSATTPPAEAIFEGIVRSKLKVLSFQDPDKVSEGLSYIWAEKQKWQKISAAMGMGEGVAKTTLKLIVSRRNSIVHEADMDAITNEKLPITQAVAEDVSSFLLKAGNAIASLV